MNMHSLNKVTEISNDLRLDGITKDYGAFRALDHVDLTIAQGEFLTLLGPSGSGKSTLLMALAGFVEPTAGNIYLGNRSIVAIPPEKRNFGVVFQGYALFPHMTVAENLAYPLKVRRISRSEVKTKVQQTLELVQLSHLASRRPRQLSGGQQQRVALARALVFSPNILLLDEPMGALDKNLRQDLQVELRQLHRRLGRTFVNVTHDQEEAMAMSDRIAIMHHGKIVQVGAPRSLYDAPKSRFVAAFLGKSNFIEGRVNALARGTAVVDTADGPVRYAVQIQDATTIGSNVTLALRPQRLRLERAINSRRVKVESVLFLGVHAELNLRCASGLLLSAQFLLHDTAEMPCEGEEVEIGWDPSAMIMVDPD